MHIDIDGNLVYPYLPLTVHLRVERFTLADVAGDGGTGHQHDQDRRPEEAALGLVVQLQGCSGDYNDGFRQTISFVKVHFEEGNKYQVSITLISSLSLSRIKYLQRY